MKHNLKFLLVVMTLIIGTGFVFAGDFKLQYPAGTDIFTVDTSGNVNASGWYTQNGVRLSELFLNITGSQSLTIEEANITVIGEIYVNGSAVSPWLYNQTQPAIDYADSLGAYNHTAVIEAGIYWNNQTNSAQNYTDNALQLSNATWSDTSNSSYAQMLNGNTSLITYQNITNLPTCSAGQHLYYDGTDLTCTADAGGDFSNVAYLNNTQTFTGVNNFTADVTFDEINVRLDNEANITRSGTSTTFSIDSSGNVVFVLG